MQLIYTCISDVYGAPNNKTAILKLDQNGTELARCECMPTMLLGFKFSTSFPATREDSKCLTSPHL